MDVKKIHSDPEQQWDANVEQEIFGNQAPYAAGSSTRPDHPQDFQNHPEHHNSAEEAPYLAHPYEPDSRQKAIHPIPDSYTHSVDPFTAAIVPSDAPPMYSQEPDSKPVMPIVSAHVPVLPFTASQSQPQVNKRYRGLENDYSDDDSRSSDETEFILAKGTFRNKRILIRTKCTRWKFMLVLIVVSLLFYFSVDVITEDACVKAARLGTEEYDYSFAYTPSTNISVKIMDGIPGNIILKESDDWEDLYTFTVKVETSSSDRNLLDAVEFKYLFPENIMQWTTILVPFKNGENSTKLLARLKKHCVRADLTITIPKHNAGLRTVELQTSEGDIRIDWAGASTRMVTMADEVKIQAYRGSVVLDGASVRKNTEIVIQGAGSVSGLLITAEKASVSTHTGTINLEVDTDLDLMGNYVKNLDLDLRTTSKGSINLVHTRGYRGRFALNSDLGTAIVTSKARGSDQIVYTRRSNAHLEGSLMIEQASSLKLFLDTTTTIAPNDRQHEGRHLPPLPQLQDLFVQFEDDPIPLQIPFPSTPPPIDLLAMRSILQILERAQGLRKLTIGMSPLTQRGQLIDQARLLAAIPASVESLRLLSYDRKIPLADEDQIAAALAQFSNEGTRAVADTGIADPKATTITTPMTISSRLKALTVEGRDVHPRILAVLLERSPALEELNMDTCFGIDDDERVSRIVSSVRSETGLKTLGFRCEGNTAGPLTVAAVMQHSRTLENLRLTDSTAFSSSLIQKFLCSAPNLKRFDTIPYTVYGELEPLSLMANDILDSKEDWVCLGLESFKCLIGGIPRPDLREKSNGRPLNGIYNDPNQYTWAQSQAIQRQVLGKLGGLVHLREITLGVDTVDTDPGNEETVECELDMEGVYFENGLFQLGIQYQNLAMSLEDGLDRLQGLKSLRRLHVELMQLRIEEKEKRWMKANWPEYGKPSRDTFWTSRRHSVKVGSERHQEDGDRFDFDWW
ncbi:hypothetical protein BGZ83_009434 [Gryganskiella cystojenkinii]|nr:hypothetical protein BGZ83_009434 [Gryganskiella cystojenkinii]